MELLGVIKALEVLKRPGLDITIFSDSRYVVDAVEKGWLFGWEKRGFSKVKNPDLWQQFLQLFRKHNIRLKWVKGHASNPYNNRCDQLATQAADGPNLLKDAVFEREFLAR